jgi:PAS domain S-box-containing protein
VDPSEVGRLVELARVCSTATDVDGLLNAALPILVSVSGAESAAIVRTTADADNAVAEADGAMLVRHELPGEGQALLMVWAGADSAENPAVDTALDLLDGGVARLSAGERLADLTARVNSAQQLANMGDYDWHIATDTNQWSDQLYRIYGHEPQAFNASYERFLSFIHPDDRERITGIHQQAYASGEPYQMIERIVRPDGEIRYLSSNGQVIQDETGTPVRMRGTCIDITETVAAERSREHLAARFRGLVESAPDAILVVDAGGAIVQANTRATRLLGGEVVGHDITELLAWPSAGGHTTATGLDGRDLQLDVITSALSELEDEGLVAVFLHDATPRLANETLAATLREVEVRRRQALEINDNVVQGLVAASYALDQGQVAECSAYLNRTLTSARAMMDGMLEPTHGQGFKPGDLVRTAAASLGVTAESVSNARRVASQPGGHTVLVVDDADDLRMLLRARMESRRGLTVIGEAADGLAAVELASELQPDLVMLDLAMPRMDGLEALPLIRAAVPGVRVIVLSGFNQSTLAEKAMEAGADRYVVKGGSMRQLLDLVDTVLEDAS